MSSSMTLEELTQAVAEVRQYFIDLHDERVRQYGAEHEPRYAQELARWLTACKNARDDLSLSTQQGGLHLWWETRVQGKPSTTYLTFISSSGKGQYDTDGEHCPCKASGPCRHIAAWIIVRTWQRQRRLVREQLEAEADQAAQEAARLARERYLEDNKQRLLDEMPRRQRDVDELFD